MAKKISVIIPVYNVKDYFEECIESVLNQSYKNLEIIIVDDGSTDGSNILCDQYAERDDRIQVLHQKNRGLAGARNAGIEKSTGEILSFIDSDDIIHQNMYKTMLPLMDQYDIVECGVQRFTDCWDIKYVDTFVKNKKGLSKIEALYNIMDNPGMSTSFCNKLFPRKLFEDVQFREGILFEDEDLIFRVINKIEKYVLIENPFYCYRYRENGIMMSGENVKRLDAILVWNERRKFCLEEGLYDLAQRSEALLYYECVNLYRKPFYKDNKKVEKYLLSIIDSNKKNFRKNQYIKFKHRVILSFGNLYKKIF